VEQKPHAHFDDRGSRGQVEEYFQSIDPSRRPNGCPKSSHSTHDRPALRPSSPPWSPTRRADGVRRRASEEVWA
jgi:hypothetical protein